MVFPQLTKGRVGAVGRGGEHVANLDVAVDHDHSVDEQLHELPALREGGRGQPGPHGLAERLDAAGDRAKLQPLLGDRVQLALLGGQGGAAAVEQLAGALELGEGDQLDQVGVQQPLLLAVQVRQRLAQRCLAAL
jgi:hypothetical protein